MQLSENFFLAEFVRSDTALRRGIDNTPDIQQIMNLKFLCENILQPLRDKFGPIVISSGSGASPLTGLWGAVLLHSTCLEKLAISVFLP